jgi:hypothetical protein
MCSIYPLFKSKTPELVGQNKNGSIGRREQGKQCAVCLNDSTSSSDYVNKQHYEC